MEELQFNPYDFANPVNNPESFAGRKEESNDVRYYLNQARFTRPIHIALTGERSAGKTSMLNMIDQQGDKFHFLVVRLDLNENDADPIEFFGRLYDSFLTAAVADGKYGGFGGHTWGAYRSLVDSDIPAQDIPLAFPSHWAAAIRGNRKISVAVLTHDLVEIQAEVNRKILIVLDECNVLSQTKITLQILRNVFMNLENFMLVIAGTPNLFPVFDEVFSPINRQFKKIPISPFDEEKETRECITRPLSRLRLDPKELFDTWPFVVGEIHRVTGGRPYEIQLLCHTMFRRVQEKDDVAMRLSLEVLDSVRLDLESGQSHEAKRLYRRYRSLTDKNLIAMGILSRVDNGTLESAALVHVLDPEMSHSSMDKDEFLGQIPGLVELGLIREVDGIFELAGDQFDEVYLRYLAASRSLLISAAPMEPEFYLAFKLGDIIDEHLRWKPYYCSDDSLDLFPADFDKMLLFLRNEHERIPANWTNFYMAIKNAQAAEDAFVRLVSFQISAGNLRFVTHGFSSSIFELKSFYESPDFLEFKNLIESVDGNLSVTMRDFSLADVPPIDGYIENDPVSVDTIARLYAEAGYSYFHQSQFVSSLEAYTESYNRKATAEVATAAAFQALHLGKWQLALTWASMCDKVNVDVPDLQQTCIAAYDRAVAEIMLGNLENCVRELDKVQESWDEALDEKGNFLLEPKLNGEDEWVLESTADTPLVVSSRLRILIDSQSSDH